jgi:hypothetical protein
VLKRKSTKVSVAISFLATNWRLNQIKMIRNQNQHLGKMLLIFAWKPKSTILVKNSNNTQIYWDKEIIIERANLRRYVDESSAEWKFLCVLYTYELTIYMYMHILSAG